MKRLSNKFKIASFLTDSKHNLIFFLMFIALNVLNMFTYHESYTLINILIDVYNYPIIMLSLLIIMVLNSSTINRKVHHNKNLIIRYNEINDTLKSTITINNFSTIIVYLTFLIISISLSSIISNYQFNLNNIFILLFLIIKFFIISISLSLYVCVIYYLKDIYKIIFSLIISLTFIILYPLNLNNYITFIIETLSILICTKISLILKEGKLHAISE